jgi:hypothetical protein
MSERVGERVTESSAPRERHAPDGIFSGINVPKVIAGTLAAVSAAVVGSFLGVAGTLIGAAVASMIGSIGTEIYERSLHRGAKKLQTLAPTFIKAPAAVGTPAVAAAGEDDRPSHTVPEPARARQIRWGRVAVIAGAVFALAMGSITAAELITGESVQSAVGGASNSGTTVGDILNGDAKSKPTPTPAPSTSTTPAPTPSDEATTPTTAPSESVAPTTTDAPTAEPTSVPPATGAPEQTAAPDGGNGENGDLNTQQGTGQTGGQTAGE